MHLHTLEAVLASPTAYSPMPPNLSLIDLYRHTTHHILAALPRPSPPLSLPPSLSPAHSTLSSLPLPLPLPPPPSSPLRHLSFTYEPGYAPHRELAGAAPWDSVPGTGAEGWGAEGDALPDVAQDARVWTYARRASDACAVLFGGAGGFEDVLCERARAGVSTGGAAGGSESRAGGVKRAFANLEVLALRVWDPSVGKDEEWWAERVRRWLPTLCALGLVELDVGRDTCAYTNLRTCLHTCGHRY